MKRLAIILCFLALVVSCATQPTSSACSYDKNAMLTLSEDAFDQDLSNGGGGWRRVANIPGCEVAAADLIAQYRDAHPQSASVLTWHEGQLRASGGQNELAIPLLLAARKDPGVDLAGWNAYVDATVAFLQRDKSALIAARQKLLAVPYVEVEGMPPLQDGYVTFPTPPGQPIMRFRWPINIEVVDGLLNCFDKPYKEASGEICKVK